jgi:parvulin-like peptidyl-prolyl isomerase
LETIVLVTILGAAAIDWIGVNQLGRRNLTADQRSLLRGRLYNRTKKTMAAAGAMKGKANAEVAQAPQNTAEAVAKKYGVSARTIKSDGEKAKAQVYTQPIPDGSLVRYCTKLVDGPDGSPEK